MEKHLKKSGSQQPGKGKPSNRHFVDFVLSIFDIAKTKDPVYLNSDQHFKFLLEFLSSNRMAHMADFLERYEKDKNYFQDFKQENYQDYLPY